MFIEKVSPKSFKLVVCNPCQSSSSLTILVPLWFIIISLVFFYFSKLLHVFSGFLQFNGNFERGKNTRLDSFKLENRIEDQSINYTN